MPINYDELVGRGVENVPYSYGDRETMLYALGLGMSRNQLNPQELHYTFEKGLNCLGRRGYMALYGQASGPVGPFDSGAIRNGSCFLTRPSLGDYTATREELLQRANEVLGWVGSGELKLHVSQTLPLEQAAEAHRQLEGRQSTGKILLTP